MITQIRIDGFKSFVDFKLDVHPRTVLLGVNGAGKSNLFDALRLVAGTMEQGLDATVAADGRFRTGGLFHRGQSVNDDSADDPAGEARAKSFRIVVGTLVESPDGPLPLRIGLNVGLVEGKDGGPDRARLLPKGSAVWVSSLRNDDWMSDLGLSEELCARIEAARAAFLRRTDAEYQSIGGFVLSGGSEPAPGDEDDLFDLFPGGRGQAELFTLAAGECASWRPMLLEPEAMRGLVPASSRGTLRHDGGNLAVVLERIQRRAPGAFSRLAGDLAALVPGVRDLRTVFLEGRQEYDFEVDFTHTGWTAPVSLSDGTLRALGLLAAYWDPDGKGLLAVEEIENGMHLLQVVKLFERLGRGAHWPERGQDSRYRQLLVTTHSPVLLADVRTDLSGSVVFLEQTTRIDPARRTMSQTTSARPLLLRDPDREPGASISPQGIERLLERLGLGV